MLVVATGAFLGVERIDGWLASSRRSAEAIASIAANFSVVFFVPALAVRYGLHHPVGRICGLALLAVSAVWGLAAAARAPGVRLGRWLVGMGGGLACGTAAVWLARSFVPARSMVGAALVVYAAAFVGGTLFAWRRVENTVLPSIDR